MITKKFLHWCLLILFLIGVLFVTSKAIAEDELIIQKSPIDSRKQVIVKGDKNEGYLQKSHIDPRQTVQYDSDGNEKGYWQKSAIDPRKTVFHKKD